MLDFLQDLMHKLFKSDIHPFCPANRVLPTNLPFGPLLEVPNLGLLLVLKCNKGLLFILQPVIL